MNAQVSVTLLAELRLQSASPSRRPDSPPTASSNEPPRLVLHWLLAPRTPQTPTSTQTHDRDPRPGALRALISLLASRPALLSAPSGSVQKGGVLHFHAPPLAACGGRGNRCGGPPGGMCPREIHHPKSGPHPTSPLTSGSNRTSPIPKRGKNRRENPRAI